MQILGTIWSAFFRWGLAICLAYFGLSFIAAVFVDGYWSRLGDFLAGDSGVDWYSSGTIQNKARCALLFAWPWLGVLVSSVVLSWVVAVTWCEFDHPAMQQVALHVRLCCLA